MAETTEQPQQRLIKIAVDNFAALSAISSAVAASLSMIFIFGYLSVFNTSLIMILEYSDIFKFILLGICIGFGLLAAFLSVINIAIYTIKDKATTTWSKVVVVSIFVFVVIIIPTLAAWLKDSPDFHYDVFRSITGLAALSFLFSSLRIHENFRNLTAINIFGNILSLYCFIYLLGGTFGLYVDTAGTPHRITLREGTNITRTLSDAKLVLFTSHHIIAKVGSEISVFQMADVLEVTSPTNDWPPLLPFR